MDKVLSKGVGKNIKTLIIAAVTLGLLMATIGLLSKTTLAQANGKVTINDSTVGYDTIREAIAVAQDGDTLNIGAGTFTEAPYVVKNNLTFIGAGEDSTTIDASNETSYGFYSNKSITLKNFTLIGPANPSGFGFKLELGAVVMENIVVKDSAKTNIDLNGLASVTLTRVTATNAKAGNGISLTNTSNVTATNVVTSGNKWGGVAVYPSAINVTNVVVVSLDADERYPLYRQVNLGDNPFTADVTAPSGWKETVIPPRTTVWTPGDSPTDPPTDPPDNTIPPPVDLPDPDAPIPDEGGKTSGDTVETDQGSTSTTADNEGDSCSEFLGLCWYWWVPIVGVPVALAVWYFAFYSKGKKD